MKMREALLSKNQKGAVGTLDILVFGPHPDDVEISCGGTVATLVKRGRKVGIVDLTRGERGTEGSAAIRDREKTDAAKILGAAVRENIGLPDTAILNSHDARRKIVKVVRTYRPRVVILPINDFRHPDHTHSEALVRDACYLSGLKNYDCDLESHRPFKVIRIHSWRTWTKPTFLIDITPVWKVKMRAIEAFASQFPKNSNRKLGNLKVSQIPEFIELRARYYGMLIGKRYAEGFVQDEPLEIEDPFDLPVASM